MKNVIFEKAQELDLYCFLVLYLSYIRVKDLGVLVSGFCVCVQRFLALRAYHLPILAFFFFFAP
jgi:hypothetical protein